MNSAYDIVWNRHFCIQKCAYDLWEKYRSNEKTNWYTAEKEILNTPLFVILTVRDYSIIDKKFTAKDIYYQNGNPIIKGNNGKNILISRRRLSDRNDLYVIGEFI